ncbi:ornithine cyclodeaminase [Georgenia soli]|uniref:Ornithine cyclodeaminase n=1 Tax=Georgenia soli TaxID=638953 RepID=A0A2A9ESF6_9MICO|nr:ornithine cyclodeaminase family protein [Georgenia soli]PFG41175.1 ornithine cyclodeaminase [Georgenia soli]
MTHVASDAARVAPTTFAGMALISADDVARTTSVAAAVDALEAALRGGLDPERDAPRSRLSTGTGELLIMPSTLGTHSGIKVLSSTPGNRDLPLIQGAFLLFEGPGQRPAAVVDGIALTNLRTPAVSALAVRHLAAEDGRPERLTVFGTGPQARAHALAMLQVRDIADVSLVGRTPQSLERLAEEIARTGTPVRTYLSEEAAGAVTDADIICCCTSSPTPLFDGALVKDGAVVVAMGSHFPDTREVDDVLISRSTVVVESRASTLREAGDVVLPIASGVLREEELLTLHGVVTGRAVPVGPGPRVFKGTGMPWEDLVVATAVHRAAGGTPAAPSSRTGDSRDAS